VSFTLLCFLGGGEWVNADTGEVVDPLISIERGGGVLCGYELYAELALLWESELGGRGWKLHLNGRKNRDTRNTRLYFKSASRRLPKMGGKRFTTKWVIWNLEQLSNHPHENVILAAKRLRRLLIDREVETGRPCPPSTQGAMGRSMLKASPEWGDRTFIPWFIDKIAREHLPGNHYSLRHGFRRDSGITLIDQQAAHHNIANTTPVPHPQSIHRRGWKSPGEGGRWLLSAHNLRHQMGLILATVDIGHIPLRELHLYPSWSQVPGEWKRWIWTPELRLQDDKCRVRGVHTALTGDRIDTALWEYSDFTLAQIRADPHPVIKPVLHSAYGSLATNKYGEFETIILGDPGNYPNPEELKLPWIDTMAHAVITRGRGTPTYQNTIAYGVITAEQTVRSLELARVFEWEHGIHVVQVYADAILVRTREVPFVPPGWSIKAELDDVFAGLPNQILSAQIQRIPGISGERKRIEYVRQVRAELC
jgi:hypothetical protein